MKNIFYFCGYLLILKNKTIYHIKEDKWSNPSSKLIFLIFFYLSGIYKLITYN